MKFDPILTPPPPPVPEKDAFTLILTASEARTLKALIGGIGLESTGSKLTCLQQEDMAIEIHRLACELYNAMSRAKIR